MGDRKGRFTFRKGSGSSGRNNGRSSSYRGCNHSQWIIEFDSQKERDEVLTFLEERKRTIDDLRDIRRYQMLNAVLEQAKGQTQGSSNITALNPSVVGGLNPLAPTLTGGLATLSPPSANSLLGLYPGMGCFPQLTAPVMLSPTVASPPTSPPTKKTSKGRSDKKRPRRPPPPEPSDSDSDSTSDTESSEEELVQPRRRKLASPSPSEQPKANPIIQARTDIREGMKARPVRERLLDTYKPKSKFDLQRMLKDAEEAGIDPSSTERKKAQSLFDRIMDWVLDPKPSR
jgi:hypothetical protein